MDTSIRACYTDYPTIKGGIAYAIEGMWKATRGYNRADKYIVAWTRRDTYRVAMMEK